MIDVGTKETDCSVGPAGVAGFTETLYWSAGLLSGVAPMIWTIVAAARSRSS